VRRYGIDNLRDYVTGQLILVGAEEQGVLPTDEQVAAAYQEERNGIIRDFHRGDSERYDQSLRDRGYEPATWAEGRREQLRIDLARQSLALMRREITEEQLTKRFVHLYGEEGDHVTVEVLFFNMYADLPADGSTPDRDALKSDARALAGRARKAWAGGTALAELVALSDAVPSKFVDAGRIDPYRPNVLGPEVDRALLSMDDPGEISAEIEVYNGFYVVRLADRATVTLDEVRDALTAQLASEAVTSEELAIVDQGLLATHPVEIELR
jgi:hypothetical protein